MPLIASARIHSDRRGRGIGRSWLSTLGGKGCTRFSKCVPYCAGVSERESTFDSLNFSMNREPAVLRDCILSGATGNNVGSVVRLLRAEGRASCVLNGESTPRRIFVAWAHGAFSQSSESLMRDLEASMSSMYRDHISILESDILSLFSKNRVKSWWLNQLTE
jgi:hypothetical protein